MTAPTPVPEPTQRIRGIALLIKPILDNFGHCNKQAARSLDEISNLIANAVLNFKRGDHDIVAVTRFDLALPKIEFEFMNLIKIIGNRIGIDTGDLKSIIQYCNRLNSENFQTNSKNIRNFCENIDIISKESNHYLRDSKKGEINYSKLFMLVLDSYLEYKAGCLVGVFLTSIQDKFLPKFKEACQVIFFDCPNKIGNALKED